MPPASPVPLHDVRRLFPEPANDNSVRLDTLDVARLESCLRPLIERLAAQYVGGLTSDTGVS